MKKLLWVLIVCAAVGWGQKKAKNVILFIGDAGGVATLNLASAYAHDAPQKLYLQSMPHLALVDTSTASEWVTDSAAGMTAIVTGQKTHNGVLSQSAAALRGKSDGAPLKTILEYAEEKGLSTGVISNMNATDATPAACYAHANDRAQSAEIFRQFLAPRFGDGVDIMVGAGRKAILASGQKANLDLEAGLKARGYTFLDNPAAMPAGAQRLVILTDNGNFDPWAVVERSIDSLAKNKKGYFLMVEWDMHTNVIKAGLDRAVAMDDLVRRTAAKVGPKTLLLFAADHSFDLRLRGGKKGEPLMKEDGTQVDPAKPKIRMENGHTGEEIAAVAQGPGSERLRGFIPNTELFRIMMAAYDWKESGGR
jgi:alkaline phosphatase